VRTGVEALRQSAEAMSLLEAGAINGNIADQIALAARYAEEGTLQNFEKAVGWYRGAAEQDDLESQLRVARCTGQAKAGSQIRVRRISGFPLPWRAAPKRLPGHWKFWRGR
jgi:TPR repeat protein